MTTQAASTNNSKGQYTLWQILGIRLVAGPPMWLPAWKDRYWGVGSRAYYTLGTVAVAFVWFLDYWNLLGRRY